MYLRPKPTSAAALALLALCALVLAACSGTGASSRRPEATVSIATTTTTPEQNEVSTLEPDSEVREDLVGERPADATGLTMVSSSRAIVSLHVAPGCTAPGPVLVEYSEDKIELTPTIGDIPAASLDPATDGDLLVVRGGSTTGCSEVEVVTIAVEFDTVAGTREVVLSSDA